MEYIQKYLPSQLSKVLIKIIESTFKSPSKYIQIASIASSSLISWSVIRWMYIHSRNRILNYPPTYYIGVPLFGSMIYLNDFAEFDMKIGSKGPITMCKVGTRYYTQINDLNLIKNSKIYKDLIMRKSVNLWNDPVNHFFLSNKDWHHRRRTAATSFLNQLNSKHLDRGYNDILNNEMYPKLDKLNNKLYKTVKEDMSYLVFAMIYSTSFGHKSSVPSPSDSISKTFFDLNTKSSREFIYSVIIQMFCGVTIANFMIHKVFNLCPASAEIDKIITKWITKHEENMNNDNDNDDNDQNQINQYYVDDMINYVHQGKLQRKEMLRDTLSAFVTGVDTTANSLELGWFYLVKYQNIQQRLYNELFKYKQKYGKFSLDHISELNILRAFIMEVLRNIKHVPHSFPRFVADNNVVISGYNIPQGSFVLGNHYYINHCAKYWERPNEFYIEHFLDKNNKYKMNKALVTFGVGKRDCMGQSLGIKNLNILFGHLVLRYKVFPNNDNDFDSIDYLPQEDGFSVSYTSVPFIIQKRT